MYIGIHILNTWTRDPHKYWFNMQHFSHISLGSPRHGASHTHAKQGNKPNRPLPPVFLTGTGLRSLLLSIQRICQSRAGPGGTDIILRSETAACLSRYVGEIRKE